MSRYPPDAHGPVLVGLSDGPSLAGAFANTGALERRYMKTEATFSDCLALSGAEFWATSISPQRLERLLDQLAATA